MPIYSIALGPLVSSIHTELPVAFCLIGKRRDEFERPAELLLKNSCDVVLVAKLTPEELMEVHAYRYAKGRGKYATKALAWVESEEEGERAKERFDAQEWDRESMVLVPVTTIG
jgi:hypothetical protein